MGSEPVSPAATLESVDRLLEGRVPTLDLGRGLDPRLHAYQERAVRHLWANPRACLFLEMGLGKTASVLQAITPEHGRVLVIAPKRVAEHVWPTEVQKWRPDLTVEVAAGTAVKRRDALRLSSARIVTLGRDNVADAVAVKGRFDTIVLDELSSFKNRDTQRWRAAMKVCVAAPYVWGLTGTPSPNGYTDLWAQLSLVDLGVRLGRSIVSFRKRHFEGTDYIAGGIVSKYRLRDGSQKWIDSRLSDICISMRSEDYLDLPPTIVNRVEVAMPLAAVKAYETMKRDLVTQLESGDHVTAASAAVASGKLSQITSGFMYHEDTGAPGPRPVDELHRAKVDAVAEIIAEAEGGVLVFYRFRHELEMLRKAMPEARTVDEPGVLEEWNAGRVPVLLAHPASAGHGLNLQSGGHTVVWASPTWSLELYQQANARLARQGQTRPVMIHHVVVPSSVDTSILSTLEGKSSVQDALMVALGL